jgi:phosphoesterase RecJ-like protein
LLDWKPFVDFVARHERLIITTHIRPDGDGLGSMLALAEALIHKAKTILPVIAGSLPARYRFMDRASRIQRHDKSSAEAFRADALIVLDTGTWNQLGDFGQFLSAFAGPKVVIDHHATQDDLGARRFIDERAESTGRLIHEAIEAMGAPITASIATYLFVALAMDTGWFRHANTVPRSFTLAEKLAAAGAQPDVLYDHLFEENTLPRLRLSGLVLDRLQVTANGLVAYTELHRDDYKATGAVPQDSEDLVNYTRSLAGVQVGLFFMEQPRGGIKVSLRARGGVDVARIAERFGGGGHRLASGAVIEGTLENVRERVLAEVIAAVEKL